MRPFQDVVSRDRDTEGSAPSEAHRSRAVLRRRILRDSPRARLAVGVSVSIGLLSTATIVVQAIALARLLAGAFGTAPHANRAILLAWLAGAAAARACLAIAGELVAAYASSSAKAALRAQLVEAAFEQAPRPGAGEAGGLATLAGRGLDALDVYVGRCIPDLVLAVTAPVALTIAVFGLDWLSAVILLCVLALFPLFGSLVGRAGAQLSHERWEQVRSLGGYLLDLFEGLPVLKAFGRTREERESLARAGEQLRKASLATLRVAFLSALVLDTLASVSIALVAVPLGLRLLDGSIRLAPALAVLVVAPEVFLPMRRASAEFHESAEGLAAASDAYSNIDTAIACSGATSERSRATAPDPRRVHVQLRSATYSFAGSTRILLDAATLEIAPKETVVVIGDNGAGKSTLLSMFLGFITPNAGSLAVGGIDIEMLDLVSWRSRLAYLPARPALLAATLEENLRVGAPEASAHEITDALCAVGAEEMLVSMPLGLQTPIGDGARPVSAGERQRIGLARIMLKDASFYVLDEPTVHLDSDAEKSVVDALQRRLTDASALIVTHRPAPLALADTVAQLHDGRIEVISRTEVVRV